jgi:hypothetical protein
LRGPGRSWSALAIREKVLGPEHPATAASLNELAGLLLDQGDLAARVRYQINAPLSGGRSCHCSRCRKAFSGSGSAYAEVAPSSFVWINGEENLTHYMSAPGWGLLFCKTCGTTLCGTYEGKVHGVTLGTVDGDPGVQIEMHTFVGSKAPWDHIGGNAPQHLELPPPVAPTTSRR